MLEQQLTKQAEEIASAGHPGWGNTMRDASSEIARLTAALEWYRDEARALAKNLESGAHTNAVLASVTVLSLDAGRRADAALGHNAVVNGG